MQGVRAFNAEVHARAFHAVFYYACSKSLSCRGGLYLIPMQGGPNGAILPPQTKGPWEHLPDRPHSQETLVCRGGARAAFCGRFPRAASRSSLPRPTACFHHPTARRRGRDSSEAGHCACSGWSFRCPAARHTSARSTWILLQGSKPSGARPDERDKVSAHSLAWPGTCEIRSRIPVATAHAERHWAKCFSGVLVVNSLFPTASAGVLSDSA